MCLPLYRSLEEILVSMRELLTDMMRSLELTAEMGERTQVFMKLRSILRSFTEGAAYFFANQNIVGDITRIEGASAAVRVAITTDMLAGARLVVERAHEMLRSFGD